MGAENIIYQSGSLVLVKTGTGYWLRHGERSIPILGSAIKALGAAMLVEGGVREMSK